MPQIRPISAIAYPTPRGGDVSTKIAPPFDVQTAESKTAQLNRDPHNIVAVDLPYLPPKTVGPDHVYAEAGQRYREWLSQGILTRRDKPALFAYQQVYKVGGKTFARRGLITRVTVQPFGKDPVTGKGGVWPHEKTFREGTEDRIRLMRATKAQLSPVFGMYKDQGDRVGDLLEKAIGNSGGPDFAGTTTHDGTQHQVWAIDDPSVISAYTAALDGADIYIADGHHRYTTAWHYRDEVAEAHGGKLPADHPANFVLMVLVSIDDPGMFILPTERVLGGMSGFSMDRLIAAAKGKLDIKPFAGSGDIDKDLLALEASLPKAGHHAIGLYDASAKRLYTATTTSPDPLAATHGDKSKAWRQLDVAIVQALLVEGICQPNFGTPGTSGGITWKYPQMDDFKNVAHQGGMQLGVIVQPTPLESVLAVSQAGEVMPQKSTFFYPKLATGLVINPLE